MADKPSSSSSGKAGQTQSSGSSSGGSQEKVQQDQQSQPSQEDIRQRDDATAATSEDTPGVRRDPDGTLVPEENAPGPEPIEDPQITAVDLRPRIDPKDRATYLGAVHRRHPDVDVPEEFQLFGQSDGERDQEEVELDGDTVDVFQVISTNHYLVFRFDGETKILSGEQARAFATDMRGVSTNVVT